MKQDYWKEVWFRKGKENTKDLLLLDGYEKTKINPKKVSEKIIEVMNIKPEDKVLEVGCGAGMLAQHIAPKCHYVGIDYSPSLVNKHIKLLGNSVLVSEAKDIPFKDKYFDKVFSYGVFFYFPSLVYATDVLAEMIRVSKNNIFVGDLPTSSHSKEHLLFYKDWFRGIAVKITDGFYEPYTKERFNVVVSCK